MCRDLAAFFVSIVGYMSVSFTIKHCPLSTIWLPKFAFICLAIGQKEDSEKHTYICFSDPEFVLLPSLLDRVTKGSLAFSVAQQPKSGLGHLVVVVSRSHTIRQTHTHTHTHTLTHTHTHTHSHTHIHAHTHIQNKHTHHTHAHTHTHTNTHTRIHAHTHARTHAHTHTHTHTHIHTHTHKHPVGFLCASDHSSQWPLPTQHTMNTNINPAGFEPTFPSV